MQKPVGEGKTSEDPFTGSQVATSPPQVSSDDALRTAGWDLLVCQLHAHTWPHSVPWWPWEEPGWLIYKDEETKAHRGWLTLKAENGRVGFRNQIEAPALELDYICLLRAFWLPGVPGQEPPGLCVPPSQFLVPGLVMSLGSGVNREARGVSEGVYPDPSRKSFSGLWRDQLLWPPVTTPCHWLLRLLGLSS